MNNRARLADARQASPYVERIVAILSLSLVGGTLAGAKAFSLQEPYSAPPSVIAKHYEPTPSHQEIASPMQLDVSLGATAARKSLLETDSKKTWIATETDAYTCQTARVHMTIGPQIGSTAS